MTELGKTLYFLDLRSEGEYQGTSAHTTRPRDECRVGGASRSSDERDVMSMERRASGSKRAEEGNDDRTQQYRNDSDHET